MTALAANLFSFVLKPESSAGVKEKSETARRLLYVHRQREGRVCNAILNFVGVLEYYTEGPTEALVRFEQVLKDDPQNLNSLQNSKRVYKELMKDAEVEKYDRELETLLGSPEKPLLVARFYAELGYALSFDFTSDNESEIYEYDILRKAVGYYESALQDPSVFSQEESCEWHFYAAKAHHRFYGRFLKTHGHRSSELTEKDDGKFLIRSLSLCQYVIRTSTDAFYTAQTWCLLGTFLFKLTSGSTLHKTVSRYLSECPFFHRLKTPDHCFETAQALLPKDAKLLCRHARFHMSKQFLNFREALELLEKSVEIDKSEYNWFAVVSRAELRKEIYRQQRINYIRFQNRQPPTRVGKTMSRHDLPPNKQLLMLAKQDYEHALNQITLTTNRVGLAEVCHWLGEETCGYPANPELLNEALGHFKKVVESVKAKKYPELHIKRSRCLRDCEEINGAIKSFKTALECTDILRTDALGELLELLLGKCRSESDSNKCVKDIAFWLDFGLRKDPKGCLSCIDHHTIMGNFTREMFMVCRELEKEKCFLLLKHILPRMICALKNIWQRYRRPELVEHHLQEAQQMYKTIKLQENTLKPRNKKYDFVVLYADEDREWVYSMVPELEKLYGFRGFFFHRDIIPGENIFRQLGEAVTESVCTISVISAAFMKDSTMQAILDMVVPEECPHVLLRLEDCTVPSQIPRAQIVEFRDWDVLVPLLRRL